MPKFYYKILKYFDNLPKYNYQFSYFSFNIIVTLHCFVSNFSTYNMDHFTIPKACDSNERVYQTEETDVQERHVPVLEDAIYVVVVKEGRTTVEHNIRYNKVRVLQAVRPASSADQHQYQNGEKVTCDIVSDETVVEELCPDYEPLCSQLIKETNNRIAKERILKRQVNSLLNVCIEI